MGRAGEAGSLADAPQRAYSLLPRHANPGTGRASPAGREPNPVLIAAHRSQEPLGITARVASPGTVPTFRGAPTEPPGTLLPAIALCPRALSCNYPVPSGDAGGQDAEGWQRGAMLCSARGTTAPLQALQSQIPPAVPIPGCIPSSGSCPPSLAVTTGPHRAGGPYSSPAGTEISADLQSKREIWGFSINRAPRRTPHSIPAPKTVPDPPKHHQGTSMKS